MDDLTLRLAGRVAELSEAPLSDAVIEAARIRLLDSIACAFGAFDGEFCSRMRRMLASPNIENGISPWGVRAPTTAENAALASAIMLRHLDLNDTVLGLTGGHPSDMIPALLALAEERDCSGLQFLRSIVIAYELYCGLCQGVRLAEAGLDQAVAAALGAVGGAAYLLGLERQAIANAIALAVVANTALFNVRMGDLSEWKACAGPNAAARGLFAARLAAEGVSGPCGIFAGEGGLEAITGPIRWPENDAPLILLTHLKCYPVCYHGQSAVDAAIALHGKIAGSAIARVHIEVNRTAHQVMGAHPTRWRPENRETADHSLPYCVGVALRSGGLRPQDFEDHALRDPARLALIGRIEVAEDAAFTKGNPNDSPARLTVDLAAGGQIVEQVTHAIGHARNPLTLSQVAEKLMALWPVTREPTQAAQIKEAVSALSADRGVKELIRALCH